MSHHKVKIEKTYTNGEKRTPYKWMATCHCGWKCLSWSWSRSLEAARYDKWIEENGQPTGGILVWALEHVNLLPPSAEGIYPPLSSSS